MAPGDPILKKVLRSSLFTALFFGAILAEAHAQDSALVKEVVRDDSAASYRLPVVGELERVVLEPQGVLLEARVETGATTSSVHAVDIEEYELDGKPWVRFGLVLGEDQSMELRLPVVRVVRIRRHQEDSLRRPVVELRIRIGEQELVREFTLADRGDLEFPMIIGRNLLRDQFVVDVARKYVIETRPEQPSGNAP